MWFYGSEHAAQRHETDPRFDQEVWPVPISPGSILHPSQYIGDASVALVHFHGSLLISPPLLASPPVLSNFVLLFCRGLLRRLSRRQFLITEKTFSSSCMRHGAPTAQSFGLSSKRWGRSACWFLSTYTCVEPTCSVSEGTAYAALRILETALHLCLLCRAGPTSSTDRRHGSNGDRPSTVAQCSSFSRCISTAV